jgi:predicted aspartyl protease
VPILHGQTLLQAKRPDGKIVNLAPQLALQVRGPVVQVSVTVEQTVAKNLIAKGVPIPMPIAGLGLIDTGASVTCIDEEAAQKLKLPVVDVQNMTSASHASTPCNVYPIQIQLAGARIIFQASRAIGAELKSQGLLLLIGRDALQNCTVFYNGLTGQFTLSI